MYSDGSLEEMRMRNRGLVVVALSASLFGAGCKKTVEGENKAWTHNVQHVQELAAQYPAFANALHEQQKRAEAAMETARAASGEAAAKQMADANSLIDSGFVSALGSFDGRTRSLRDKLVTAATTGDPLDQAAARAVSDDAQRILRNIDDAMKAGAPDPAAATALLSRLQSDLTSATANVDRVIDAAKKRKADAAKATGPTGVAGGATTGGAPVAKVQWKCSYCQHMNDDSRTKCENCGAPRPAPAAPKPAPAKPGAKKK